MFDYLVKILLESEQDLPEFWEDRKLAEDEKLDFDDKTDEEDEGGDGDDGGVAAAEPW